ncbi:MAG: hypothetical protein HZB92_06045 [Euryarchaeota archaeon]|nr:hypothetical protein [Euryarchaeota archaeon]
MEIKYFRCVECARKYVEYLNYNRQKDKGYRKKYWRNFSIIMVTVILLFLSPEIYYAFQGNAQVPENFWSTCLLGIVALGFIFGILGASTVKSIQIKKKDMPAHLADYEQLAYLDKIRPTLCPVCGKNVENDLFKTQKELDRRRGVSFQEKFARFGEKYTVRDYLICSKCGYSDPASIAWGLRMHVKRFGYSSLEGTIYENEAKHAIRFLYGK